MRDTNVVQMLSFTELAFFLKAQQNYIINVISQKFKIMICNLHL
jgi:hypothetical protein